jgi:DNA mismatch endonuclease, patch repair protein
MPKSRMAYWEDKFARNVERDLHAEIALKALGWDVLIVWECDTKDADQLTDTLLGFLSAS